MKTIAAALVQAQRGFAPALKTSTNPHFRSKYADLSACIEAVIDSLNAAGIALLQKQHPHDGGVCIETVFVHESGETISAGMLTVPAAKQDAQGYGSALTYARRYSLMAACGIAPEDDDGNSASKARKPPAAQPPPPAPPPNGLSAERTAELDEMTLYMIECDQKGEHLPAIRLWYADDSWSADTEAKQEERLYVWGNLKQQSKLRAAIKANKPADN